MFVVRVECPLLEEIIRRVAANKLGLSGVWSEATNDLADTLSSALRDQTPGVVPTQVEPAPTAPVATAPVATAPPKATRGRKPKTEPLTRTDADTESIDTALTAPLDRQVDSLDDLPDLPSKSMKEEKPKDEKPKEAKPKKEKELRDTATSLAMTLMRGGKRDALVKATVAVGCAKVSLVPADRLEEFIALCEAEL